MNIRKITASKRDDILRRRSKYDAETQQLKDRDKAADDLYDQAQWDARKELEKAVSDLIGSTSLKLDIRANQAGFGVHGWEIRIEANEREKFDDNVALAWNWEVSLDSDGNIKKDSGSWSGLKVTTPEQVADLEESVRIIKTLNNVDWKEILSRPLVNYYDYHDKDLQTQIRERSNSRPKFEDELISAELEDLVGSNTAIKLGQDQYYRGPVYILVTGVTDKFVKGYIFSQYVAERLDMNADAVRDSIKEERRTAKSNLIKNGEGFETLELN